VAQFTPEWVAQFGPDYSVFHIRLFGISFDDLKNAGLVKTVVSASLITSEGRLSVFTVAGTPPKYSKAWI